MRKIFSMLILGLFILPSFALAADPIRDLIDVAVPVNVDGSYPKLEEVRAAIISGCRAKGWTPAISGERAVKATILVRGRHYAEIEILYSAKSYSIIYKSSQELDYNEKKRTIHRNYNKWVVLLSNAIQRKFGVHAQGY